MNDRPEQSRDANGQAPANHIETTTIDDVACPACGCLCDDLSVTVRGNGIESIRNACSLAEPWYRRIRIQAEIGHAVAGEPVDYATAIAAAGELLRRSRAPLVYGLSRSSTPGQRAAVALAERWGAVVDTTASVCHGPSIMAIQEVGESTCSLGEVRQRSDLVIYWGCDPVRSHPRHLERYAADPAGEFLPHGRRDRRLVVIDTVRTATSAVADRHFTVRRGGDFELIARLRGMLRGRSCEAATETELVDGDLRELFELMVGCRYGAVFFGLGIAQSRLGHLTVVQLLKLVAELNARTRFIARRMRIPGDVAGADSVLCWQTGFPFAVDFSRGYPRYNPGEFTANELLERGDVDCVLFVGSEAVPEFSASARAALRNVPVIALESAHLEGAERATVRFSTSVYGVHAPGVGYRMDEMPIPMRSFLRSSFPTDEDVLNRLLLETGGN